MNLQWNNPSSSNNFYYLSNNNMTTLRSVHYPSLELCKKLQNTWLDNTEKVIDDYWNIDDRNLTRVEWDNTPMYPCPSVMELLDEMPTDIDYLWENRWLRIMYVAEDEAWEVWEVWYLFGSTWRVEYWTIPNALAEMRLWLVENGYINKAK